MAKLESNFKNMVIVLTTVALGSAFLLALAYNLTSKPIERAKLLKQQKAIEKVLPSFDICNDAEIVNDLNVYKAYKNGQFVGAAVESFSPNGFGGDICVMVGFDREGNIHNYEVLEQKETPGLGTKMVDWFKIDKGNQSIINKNPKDLSLKITKDGGTIDGITASTISSRAFLETIMTAYLAYSNNSVGPDAHSGATSEVQKEIKLDSLEIQNLDTVKTIPVVISPQVVPQVKVVENPDTPKIRIRKPKIIKTDSLVQNHNNLDLIEEELLKLKDSVISSGKERVMDTTHINKKKDSVLVKSDSIATIQKEDKNER